ncbi:hypothetical protein QJS04_geneDACA022998 [Acorus gramineus]|uniref:Uncharacterized protein n=1 Tax=Acorus gramineus TaxID=55184 RepID=A0AAV9BPB7_ACOGR|nr:hypothetical protein QJS04_geneDACA022998 [Acorus gramineus]
MYHFDKEIKETLLNILKNKDNVFVKKDLHATSLLFMLLGDMASKLRKVRNLYNLSMCVLLCLCHLEPFRLSLGHFWVIQGLFNFSIGAAKILAFSYLRELEHSD